MHQPAVVNTVEPPIVRKLVPVVHTTCPQSAVKKKKASLFFLTHARWNKKGGGLKGQHASIRLASAGGHALLQETGIVRAIETRRGLVSSAYSCGTAGVTAQSIHSHLNPETPADTLCV
jgi:hypothetical protein